jgi:hypothetical protein
MRGPEPRIHLQRTVYPSDGLPGQARHGHPDYFSSDDAFVQLAGMTPAAASALRQRRPDIRRTQDAPENAASRSSF